ncbi:MAG: FAD:protein FMN transferase, partial [Bacteroidaceae bacterium]|nr:FAD:protein FMN transferase [Bacteroidaceae bacterium]
TNEGKIFGTTYHIKYASTRDYQSEIDRVLNDVDMSMSLFKAGSTLSKFNANQPYDADPMFVEVVELSQQISDQTHGAFDITVAPLVNAWGFGFKHKDKVTPKQIDSLRKNVGYKLLKVENHKVVKLNPLTTVDMGAVAKGYAVDQVAKLLSEKGCKNYMIEIGGEVVVRGENPEGKRWTLGINKPIEDSTKTANEIQTLIRLSQGGVATSGNYRNFYYQGGKKFAHTIDPKTGYPVQHSLLSATVIAPTCAQADAFATSFMVMGLEAAQQVLAQRNDLAAYLIYADSNGKLATWSSANMQQYIVK